MKLNDTFLQTCMCWLTEISVHRYRIIKMRKQLSKLKPEPANDAVSVKYSSLVQGVQIALNKLDATESRIIYSMQKNTNWKMYCASIEDEFTMNSEEDLFENMKMSYNLLIELQRAFYHLFEVSISSEKAEQIIGKQITQTIKINNQYHRIHHRKSGGSNLHN